MALRVSIYEPPRSDEDIYIDQYEDEEGEAETETICDENEEEETVQENRPGKAETPAKKKESFTKTVSLLFQNELTVQPHDSISDSTEEEELIPIGSFMFRKKLPPKRDFFAILGHLPDIDQISLTDSMKRELKGETEGSSELDIDEAEEGEGPELEEDKVGEKTESSTTEFSEYEFPTSESEEEVVQKISDEHLFDALADAKTVFILEEFDYDAWQRKEAERLMIRDTQNFLRSLVECVVDYAEYVDPKAVLRQNLDRFKLFKKLVVAITELHVDRKVNEFLQRKCVDYYRRLKIFRPITPDTADTLDEDIARSKVNYDILDCLLGRENSGRDIITKRIADLEAEEIEFEERFEHETLGVEAIIRKTFSRRGIERLEALAEKKIKEMLALRSEISQVRVQLIKQQHMMAILSEKAARLEIVGDGLHLRDFERLETDAYALDKKVEERSNELNRIRSRYNTYTHTAAHIREKQSMNILELRLQKESLRYYQDEKECLRDQIYQMKLSRMNVQNKINELTFQNSLIAKPALMHNYDETKDRIEIYKAKVEKMRAELTKIESRIAKIEKLSS